MNRTIPALCAGFGLGLILANLYPAPPGRWAIMMPAVVISLFFAFVLPWFTAHYRIERSDRERGGGS
jgi:hypothetical protein